MLARLYPHAPKLGYVLQSYTDVQEDVRFLAARGWYRVDAALAEKLKNVPQQDRYPLDLGGKPAFMIAKDEDEARALDEKVAKALRIAAGEDTRIGTASAPVSTKSSSTARPGQRSTVAVSDEGDAEEADSKPKTRRRRAE